MPKDLDPRVAEIEELLVRAKSKPHFFALAKAKEGGIVLKADPKLNCDMMVKQCKAAGGQANFMTQGVLSTSGRLMQFKVEDADVPKSLPLALKQWFQDLKIKVKAEFVLPGGAVLGEGGSGDVGESEGGEAEGDGSVRPGGEAGGDGTEVPGDADGLAERIRALAPRVKDMVAAGTAGADRLAKALQMAFSELKAGASDKAAALVDAIEKALGTGSGGEGGEAGSAGVRDGSVRNALMAEFEELKGDIRRLVAGAEAAVGKNVTAAVKLFGESIKSDLDKAGQVLAALKKYLATELPRLDREDEGSEGQGQEKGNPLDDLVEGAKDLGEKIGEKIGEATDKAKEAAAELARTVRDRLRPSEDRKDMAVLQALGMSWDEADKLVGEKEDNDNVVDDLLTDRMGKAGVPADRREALIDMARSDPKAFVAALATLEGMDKDGAVDVSPDAMQESREALEKVWQVNDRAEKALAAAEKALAAALKASGEASGRVGTSRAAAEKAADDLKVFKARLGDISKLAPKDAEALAKEGQRLANENEKAKAALEKAIEDEKKASMDYADASDKLGKAETAAEKTRGPLETARKANEKKEGKKALLDAMAFGPLSPSGKALSDEDKAAIAAAFAKDPMVAEAGMAIAVNAPNPSAVAKNLGMVAGKAQDGFADKDGNKLDLPEEERRAMAANALRMGGMLGDDYFKGFEDYLKSGKQLDPDPFGSLDKPLEDPKAEALRKKEIVVKRTAALGEAAIGPDGKVDFASEKAKAAMDQMMFHPGSLKVATPAVNAKMAETRKLFEDPATKDRANGVIDRTRLPGPTDAGRTGAVDLVARTTGKAPGSVTDGDAKAAVLSAMMTPMSQGPVGSCFATAPVRNIRETDPVRAMDEFSKLATTGLYTASDGMQYPANRRAPQGENPLMRSLEYSVATAVQEQTNGIKRKQLGTALMTSGKGLAKIKDIPGLTGKWADGTVPDPTTGKLPEGIQSKLRKLIAKELKFEYNAGLDARGPGGGDGHSTNGVYQIFYKGKAIESDADFKAAMQEIGLAAAGETKDSDPGKAIIALVTSDAFLNDVKDAYGPAPTDPAKEKDRTTPWNLGGGGLERDTIKLLNGGNKVYQDIVPKAPTTPPQTEGQRTRAMLEGILTAQASMTGEMVSMGTTGTNANHAFNTMPGHPSLAKMKGGTPAEKIQSELVEPGKKVAATKLPAEQAARLYEDQLQAEMKGCPDAERDLIMAALKKAPKTEMTPKEVKDKVFAELAAYRDAQAQRRSDEYVANANKERAAKGEAELTNAQKAKVLDWYKKNVNDRVTSSAENALANAIETPEVVIADTNWGTADSQTLFVVRTDPVTGDLKMFTKDAISGKLSPAGKNWADAKWDTVK